MEICDFCSCSEVVKRFECADFDSPSMDAGVTYPNAEDEEEDLVLASEGYWAACANCAALVEAGDVDRLIKRALDEHELKDGNPHPLHAELELHLRRTYDLFFENRVRA